MGSRFAFPLTCKIGEYYSSQCETISMKIRIGKETNAVA